MTAGNCSYFLIGAATSLFSFCVDQHQPLFITFTHPCVQQHHSLILLSDLFSLLSATFVYCVSYRNYGRSLYYSVHYPMF
ncbi:hypothetical protein SODALDRAFT_34812 [Sodiomyces alkalinus F11]|uniref:Uncharacterized protein n=1 Tax=Sodiomyces alkalinus (strain CBS 110278 / VKM F-3762 / F11) TaxID=1314773 RepID=A0A3N2Q914_SODAK|nr:hypothetical protein SODALDRAFT_34812 [Sodiomyces alkalinus F11]ROT43263.1 hypothetical protein SODALDRAFT_34812 [Sodiomyces alkalinus F11]